jgi:hypothetical protein
MKENTVLCCPDEGINTITDKGKHSTDEGKHSTDIGKHSTDKVTVNTVGDKGTPQQLWRIYCPQTRTLNINILRDNTFNILAPPAV